MKQLLSILLIISLLISTGLVISAQREEDRVESYVTRRYVPALQFVYESFKIKDFPPNPYDVAGGSMVYYKDVQTLREASSNFTLLGVLGSKVGPLCSELEWLSDQLVLYTDSEVYNRGDRERYHELVDRLGKVVSLLKTGYDHKRGLDREDLALVSKRLYDSMKSE